MVLVKGWWHSAQADSISRVPGSWRQLLVIFTLTVKFIPDTDHSWRQQAGGHGHDGEAGSGGGDGSHRRIHLHGGYHHSF